MQGVAILHIKQYELSAIKESRESIIILKICEYLLDFEVKFKSLQAPSKRLGKSSFLKKIRGKNLVGLSL
jgi:hypothetical protein